MYICDKGEIVNGVIRTIQKIRSDVAEPTERLGYPDYIVEDQINRLLPEFSSAHQPSFLVQQPLQLYSATAPRPLVPDH